MPSQYHLRQSFCFFWCKCSTVTVSLCKGLERLPHPWKMDQPWVFCLQCYYVDFSDFSIDCLYGLGNFGFKASTCFEPPGIHSQRKARWNPREVANLQLAFFTRWVEWEKSSSPKKNDLPLLWPSSLGGLKFAGVSVQVYKTMELVKFHHELGSLSASWDGFFMGFMHPRWLYRQISAVRSFLWIQ